MSTNAPYRYALLLPKRARNAASINALLLGKETFGIEVTDRELAARCELGNVDPQHSGSASSMAAIEAVLDLPLPRLGARLVTIRRDADALGSMAVLSLRARGVPLDEAALARITSVGAADRFARGQWPGPRPFPEKPDDIDEVGLGVGALGAVQAGALSNSTPIATAVEAIERWILSGEAPVNWRATAAGSAASLFGAYSSGAVSIEEFANGQIAKLLGAAPGSLALAYRRAPVVVAETFARQNCAKERIRKLTIAQYDPSYLDMDRLAQDLNMLEPGWGGSATLLGSPQGASSALSLDACLFATLRRWRTTAPLVNRIG